MHHEATRKLYESYPLEDKNDFFPAYLYLKYIEHFAWHVCQAMGIPTKDLPEELDEGIVEMLKSYVQEIIDTSPSLDTNIYHAKVVKLQDAIKLVTQKEDLVLPVSETVMPFKIARDVILRNPDSISVGTCACRSIQPNPCLPAPMEVCLMIGDPFASFIAAQNPKFRKISQQEAIKVLEGSHKRGDVHCAYFKKELGNSLYCICNCCSCCCMGIKMWNLVGGLYPFLAPSGYVAEVGEDCNGCGKCADNVCRFNAISFDQKTERPVINMGKCMGCGVCEDVCPVEAISLRREPLKGEPLDLDELKSQRDVM